MLNFLIIFFLNIFFASFIHIKSGSCEETFIVEDEDLMVAISEFFTSLAKCKSK